jgi:DeoR/GlpR family transcriptional regulator of sugar metabolism
MRPQERQERILAWMAQHGAGTVHELAEKLDVSQMTVRRDLRILQEAHLLSPVSGGAEVRRSASEMVFEVKQRLYRNEKEAVAHKALELIAPDMTVAFSAGTTTWAVAHCLRPLWPLTIVTNSTNIALELQKQGWSQIILSGGNFRTPSDALVGPFAEYTVGQLHTDLLFLGVHGLDLDYGISTPNIQEAAVDQALIRQTETVVVVMDQTKWGIKALARIVPVNRIHMLITPDLPEVRPFIARLRDEGVQVLAVPIAEACGIQREDKMI